jgi:hypothetical protein
VKWQAGWQESVRKAGGLASHSIPIFDPGTGKSDRRVSIPPGRRLSKKSVCGQLEIATLPEM